MFPTAFASLRKIRFAAFAIKGDYLRYENNISNQIENFEMLIIVGV